MIVVYTYVVGDLLHIGHLRCLQQAKALGDYLVVGVLTDSAVMAYKRIPVIPFEQRIELINNLKCVDETVRQDNVDPTETIKVLSTVPDILTHGDDWDDDFPGAEYMHSIGKLAICTKYTKGICTTDLIYKLMNHENK